MVEPGADGEVQHVVRIVRRERVPDGDVAVDVLLVPERVDQHGGHRERAAGGEQLVERLPLPERVVGRVRGDLAEEAELVEAAAAAEFARGHEAEVVGVFVIGVGPPALGAAAIGLLLVDVTPGAGAEGAVVEPVVAGPAVDHGVDRHGGAKRRMRVDQRHQGRETVVGDPEDADPAVALGHVLRKPVDGVVGVGRLVDTAAVERAGERPGHDVAALRAVLAADVLQDADEVVLEHEAVRDVAVAEHGGEMGARMLRHALGRAVGSAGEQHRRVAGAARDEDDGREPDAVPHRDHDVALDVVERGGDRREVRRDLGGERGGCGVGGGREQGEKGERPRQSRHRSIRCCVAPWCDVHPAPSIAPGWRRAASRPGRRGKGGGASGLGERLGRAGPRA